MAKAKGRDTWRLKEWYDIIAPPMFGSTKIGETMATEPEQIEGRVLETTLSDLTDDFSKSHVKLRFKLKGVQDGQISTEFVGHALSREYIRSQVRRRVTKVDCITDIASRDGRKLRVKAMAISLNRVRDSHIHSIHLRMEKTIKDKSRKLEFDQLVQELVLGKLASDIYKEVKEICPIRRVEVQKSRLID